MRSWDTALQANLLYMASGNRQDFVAKNARKRNTLVPIRIKKVQHHHRVCG